MAALPGTFDRVPQILWERAIISRIKKRDAGSGKHDEAGDRASGGEEDNEQSERGKGYSAPIPMSREYCENGTKAKTICQNMRSFGSNGHK